MLSNGVKLLSNQKSNYFLDEDIEEMLLKVII